ncbi:alkane oxidation protein activator PraB [Pseudomonas edaphica]|uniref:alkane oxidation protein activator PraB n=1 Tax=Pseudomonas edaphica TaxID=2006980 RepID=UPI003D152B4C
MSRLLRRASSTLLLAGWIGIATVAQAAEFAPAGLFSSGFGTLTIRAPSTFGASLTCGVAMSGNVSAFTGVHISTVSITGGGYCSLLKPKLSWRMSAYSMTSAWVDDVGFSVTGIPGSNCGPTEIYASWNNATHQLTVFNQALSGNCTLERLDIVLPTLSIVN